MMRVTIKDIAAKCGVSITTVSMVVNGKAERIGKGTVERVRSAIAELDYQPNSVARSMITKRTHSIGLILPDVRNPFFSELAKGAEDFLNDNGYGVFLCNTDGLSSKEDEYIKLLRARFTDGLIITTQNTMEESQILEGLRRQDYPFVLVERYLLSPGDVPLVRIDNSGAAKDICSYLFRRGHQAVGCISGPLETTNARQRLEGYHAARMQADSRFSWVVEGNYRTSGGYDAIMGATPSELEQLDAVFACNDLMGYGAIAALHERGFRVPEDISIVGFDGISFPAALKPQLTTVQLNIREMGREAARIVLSLINGSEPVAQSQMIPYQIAEKDTVRDG